MDCVDLNEIKKSRHKAEIPLIIIAVILNIGILTLMMLGFIYRYKVEDSILTWFDMDNYLVSFLAGVGYWFAPTFLIVVAIRIIYSVKRMCHECYFKGVRVGNNQFPEIYEIEKNYGELFKFKHIPKTFVSSSSSTGMVLNVPISGAYFVCIAPGVAVYTPDLVRFEMARNYAHIYFGHRSLIFYILTFCAQAIPIFGNLLRRTMEYSADYAAQCILGQDMTIECVIKSCAHYLVARKMDVDDYYNRVTSPCGTEASYYYFFVNMFSDISVPRYRIKALSDSNKHGRLL